MLLEADADTLEQISHTLDQAADLHERQHRSQAAATCRDLARQALNLSHRAPYLGTWGRLDAERKAGDPPPMCM